MTVTVTQYGFKWGPAVVERLAHVEGRGRVLEVRTDHARVQIYVTEKGRKIEAIPLPPYENRSVLDD